MSLRANPESNITSGFFLRAHAILFLRLHADLLVQRLAHRLFTAVVWVRVPGRLPQYVLFIIIIPFSRPISIVAITPAL